MMYAGHGIKEVRHMSRPGLKGRVERRGIGFCVANGNDPVFADKPPDEIDAAIDLRCQRCNMHSAFQTRQPPTAGCKLCTGLEVLRPESSAHRFVRKDAF